jgi:uncharacterized membrane protein
MGGWGEFAAAFVLFVASHSVPARPALKARIVGAIGRTAYLAGFIALSLTLLVWLVVAAGRAPYVGLWDQQIWQRWLANVVMPAAVGLAVFGVGAVNPLSFGGRSAGFDSAHPGIAGLVRHPLLWSLLLWASVHLVANGDLAHVLLFGGFAIMALAGMFAIDARHRRQWGHAEWARLTRCTAQVPGAAWLSGRWRPLRGPGMWRPCLVVALWLAALWLHPVVTGVSPLP